MSHMSKEEAMKEARRFIGRSLMDNNPDCDWDNFDEDGPYARLGLFEISVYGDSEEDDWQVRVNFRKEFSIVFGDPESPDDRIEVEIAADKESKE